MVGHNAGAHSLHSKYLFRCPKSTKGQWKKYVWAEEKNRLTNWEHELIFGQPKLDKTGFFCS